jgi:hypothetical protein
VSKKNGGPDRVKTQTCFKFNKVGHIATYCPDKTDKTSNVSGTKKTEPAGAAPEAKVLASWKYIELKDISVSHKNDEGQAWKFCTKCKCKATNKKGFFQLTHLDSEHNDDHWNTYKKVEANITKVDEDPSHAIPLGPLAVKTLEPTSGSEYEDEMMFTGVWYTPDLPIDSPNEKEDFSPAAYCCPTKSKPPGMRFMAVMMRTVSKIPRPCLPMLMTVPLNLRCKTQSLSNRKKNYQANVQDVLLEAEGEGTEWIECDNCCDLKSSIDSSYFDKLTVVTFAWIICMGVIHSLLDFGWTKCVRPP